MNSKCLGEIINRYSDQYYDVFSSLNIMLYVIVCLLYVELLSLLSCGFQKRICDPYLYFLSMIHHHLLLTFSTFYCHFFVVF